MFYNVRHTHRSDHGDMEERSRVVKHFDPPLSKLGESQAFTIGEKLIKEIGREKEILFIVSPYQRCLKTAEWILLGMVHKWTNLKHNKFFVEDSVKEIQLECCVKEKENFLKLEFFENKNGIVGIDLAHNKLEFLNNHRGMNFEFPETWDSYHKRLDFVLENIQNYAKDNKNVVPIFISHGCVTESLYMRDNQVKPDGYHYGSVNKFELCPVKEKWEHTLYDGKYY